jgi:hypothetical protein
MAAKAQYEPFLDGVRGVMAMWVFIFHASFECGFSTRFIPPGAIAVDGFMFLSGLSNDAKFHCPGGYRTVGRSIDHLEVFD